MKKVFGLLMITVLLWSCGSQFTRSKYDRYMFNRSKSEAKEEARTESTEVKSDGIKTPAVATDNSQTELDALTNVNENLLNANSSEGIWLTIDKDAAKINISTVYTAVTMNTGLTDNCTFHIIKQKEKDGFKSELNYFNSVTELPIEKNKKSKKMFFKNRLATYLNKTNRANRPMNELDSDGMLILMLILSLILPPLAVFLKDSGITGLFWLTLILCLCAGGGAVLISGGIFSFWGIAFVLALLRVLDVI